MSVTVQQIIDSMGEKFNPAAAAGLKAVFQFDLSGDGGGQWHLIIEDQACQVAAGSSATPNVTFNMASTDFVDMMTGKLSGMSAFFSGKLKVSGDLMLAQRLEGLFKK